MVSAAALHLQACICSRLWTSQRKLCLPPKIQISDYHDAGYGSDNLLSDLQGTIVAAVIVLVLAAAGMHAKLAYVLIRDCISEAEHGRRAECAHSSPTSAEKQNSKPISTYGLKTSPS